MYNQPETILEQYDLEIKQITKGRGAFICDTDQGSKLLMPFRGSKERAAFMQEVLRKLQERGFAVEQICPTKDKEAVAVDEMGTRYWLKERITGSECSTSRESEMLAALEELAKLHRTLSECNLVIPSFMKNERNEPRQLYRRHYRELIKVKNYVHSRKKRNEFEMHYQEQYPHYMKDAKDAISLLENVQKQGQEVCGLCHGDFNQHNVLHTAEGVRIVNFENMGCNEPMMDLANFIRKMLEKNHWDTQLGMRMIATYDYRRPMSDREKKLLYLLLLFPEKFWKISNHYNNSHKAWVSQRDIEKLKRMIEIEPARQQFLENLFSFVEK